jgi:hypothetical protein
LPQPASLDADTKTTKVLLRELRHGRTTLFALGKSPSILLSVSETGKARLSVITPHTTDSPTKRILFQTFMARRLAIAEQVQSGKITMAEGSAAASQKYSEMLSEARRRLAIAQTAAAQPRAAAAQQRAAMKMT